MSLGDALSPSKHIAVGVVDCTKNRRVCNKERVTAYPGIKLFYRDNQTSVVQKNYNSRDLPGLLDWVKQRTKVQSAADEGVVKRNDRVVEEKEYGLKKVDSMGIARDAATALMFVLENSLFLGSTTLDGEQYYTAFRWLEFVCWTFPVDAEDVCALKQTLAKKQIWKYEDWKQELVRWKIELEESSIFANGAQEWKICATYTCGLWSMFHILVSHARYTTPPMEVANLIKEFVQYFFGCEECVRHFLERNPKSEIAKIQTHDQLELWLWNMHNQVNQNVKHPLWPTIQMCSNCRSLNRGQDINFRDQETLDYLQHTYFISSPVEDTTFERSTMYVLYTALLILVIVFVLYNTCKKRRPITSRKAF